MLTSFAPVISAEKAYHEQLSVAEAPPEEGIVKGNLKNPLYIVRNVTSDAVPYNFFSFAHSTLCVLLNTDSSRPLALLD